MRKMIIPIVLILLSLVSVNAQYSPLPISGQIFADNPDGLTIRVTNMRSGVTMQTTANGAGQYMIEWANSPLPSDGNRYKLNDTFKAEILDCISDSKCTQTIIYSGQPEIFMTFDLFDIEIITTTSTTTTTISSCDSCCPFVSCSSCCPDCPTTTTTTCPSCPVCPTCPDCPKIDYTWLYTGGAVIILGIIAIAVGAYKGRVQIRYYKKYYDPVALRWKYKWVILFSRAD